MGEINSDSGEVKRRLLSLYGSSSPQLFSQLLGDYDPERRQLSVESARVYDLRAAARVQILFADGFKAEAAVKFLREAIRHIETFGLPSSEGPALYPDGREVAGRADDRPPAGIESAPAEHRPEAEAAPLQSFAPAHESPAPAALSAAGPARQSGEMDATKESLMGRIPALLSSLYGAQHLTALNLDFESQAKPLSTRR